jgi:hypothetical protein
MQLKTCRAEEGMKTLQGKVTGAVGYVRDVLMLARKYLRCISICRPVYNLHSICRSNGGERGALITEKRGRSKSYWMIQEERLTF